MNDVYKQSGFALIKRGAFAAAGPFRRHFLIPLLSYLLPPGSCIVSLNSNVLLSVTLLHIHFAIPLGKKKQQTTIASIFDVLCSSTLSRVLPQTSKAKHGMCIFKIKR
jgi:hypothetical protein